MVYLLGNPSLYLEIVVFKDLRLRRDRGEDHNGNLRVNEDRAFFANDAHISQHKEISVLSKESFDKYLD